MKHLGLNTHRFKQNPEEKRFSDAWVEQQQGKTLAYILDPKPGNGYPPDPSDRDEVVGATVIQWLGSPVGQAFLEDLGYKHEPNNPRR